MDHHRLVPDVDYSISLQHGKSISDNYDAAADPLFNFVDEAALNKPTFKAFLALLDNYVSEVGVVETVSAEEKVENKQFLNMVCDTACVKYVHRWLVLNKLTHAITQAQFVEELNCIWFGL